MLFSDVLGKRVKKITLRVEQFPARGAFQVIVRAAALVGPCKLIACPAVSAEKFAHCPLRAQLVKMAVNGNRRSMDSLCLVLYTIVPQPFLQQMKMKTIFIFAKKVYAKMPPVSRKNGSDALIRQKIYKCPRNCASRWTRQKDMCYTENRIR